MKKKIAALLTMTMIACSVLAGCGQEGSGDVKDTNADKQDEKKTVYAVEAGSAGEEAAKEKGWDVNSVASQADALMEVASGTSDAAIIDLLMAGAMIGEGTSYPNLVYTDKLTTEEYGVGCRKDSNLPDYINVVFADSYNDGTMKTIAEKYGVQEALIEQTATDTGVAITGDLEYIQKKGTMIVGITDFAPMDYKEAGSDEWIGFDADMARLVGKKLGVEVQFVEIDWDTKTMELDSKNIDVVWNGMTITEEVKAAMACSNAYCNNAQVVVVKNAK